MQELPDKLDARRHQVAYKKDDKVYIVVSLLEGVPVEVFANFGSTSNHETFYIHAAWNAITRLASLGLRSSDGGLEKVVEQLERSSLDKKDAPGILVGVLKKYLGD